MQQVDKQLGEYRLLAQLAKGGQSVVFLAARSGPHGFFRPVVIKAIPDDFKGKPRLEALFYKEATLSSRFSHPHVVTIHDARRADDDHFMVMDYVAGQTVADFAQRSFSSGKGINLEETLTIVADAARGLNYVHCFEDVDRRSYSIVHCDISPQNLIVTYTGITRVFDFGISQVVGDSDTEKSALVGGKLSYMSPEQCENQDLDPRSDIFSLGIILYELATGQRLFRRNNDEETKKAILSGTIAPPSLVASHLDEKIDDVILKALALAPEDRYQTAGELEDDLKSLLSARGVDREEVRSELGEKVSELFSEERDQVTSTLHDAREAMADEYQNMAAKSDPSERALELEVELQKSKKSLTRVRKNARRATEVASALTDEVTTLQRRQHWLVIGICGLSLVTLAIATMAYLSHGGSF